MHMPLNNILFNKNVYPFVLVLSYMGCFSSSSCTCNKETLEKPKNISGEQNTKIYEKRRTYEGEFCAIFEC